MKIFRHAIAIAFIAALVFAGYAMFGGLDSPAQRVMSATRKCRTALSTNLIESAEGYCSDALRRLQESRLGGFEAGEALASSPFSVWSRSGFRKRPRLAGLPFRSGRKLQTTAPTESTTRVAVSPSAPNSSRT